MDSWDVITDCTEQVFFFFFATVRLQNSFVDGWRPVGSAEPIESG